MLPQHCPSPLHLLYFITHSHLPPPNGWLILFSLFIACLSPLKCKPLEMQGFYLFPATSLILEQCPVHRWGSKNICSINEYINTCSYNKKCFFHAGFLDSFEPSKHFEYEIQQLILHTTTMFLVSFLLLNSAFLWAWDLVFHLSFLPLSPGTVLIMSYLFLLLRLSGLSELNTYFGYVNLLYFNELFVFIYDPPPIVSTPQSHEEKRETCPFPLHWLLKVLKFSQHFNIFTASDHHNHPAW